MKRTVLLLFVFIALLSITAGSQDRESLWREFVRGEGGNWKATFREDKTVRSLFGQGLASAKSGREASSRILKKHHLVFGIDHPSDLKLEQIEESETGTHIYYRQYFSGIPVAGSEVGFHFDRSHRLIAASSNYFPGLRQVKAVIGSPDLAQKHAIKFFRGAAKASIPRLMILPAGTSAVPVWRIEVEPFSITQGARILYVDAADPRIVLRVLRAYADAEGRGSVFEENPIVTPRVTEQKFKYMDASRSLSGNFVKTFNANFEEWFRSFSEPSDFTTASDPGRRYDYETSDARFSEAMAYFHINRVHDRWRSVGFNKLNLRFPIIVNVVTPEKEGFDNAFYTRRGFEFRNGVIVMGAGKRLENLGHDADVYYHEYGHAVLDRARPQFFDSIENNYSFAFHEGFGDISAAATTGNPKLAEFGLKLKSGRFVGRNIDNRNRYPQNVILPGFNKSESHHTGLIVGGAWWEIQKSIGRDQAQRILYRSLPMLPVEMTFFDWRDAMLAADQTLNGGSNAATLQRTFANRGLGEADPGQKGSVRINSLKTGEINFQTGAIKLKSNFKKGDVIEVFANYTGSGLTPGYNLIAVRFDLSGPANSSITGFAFLDEVVNGTRSGKNGALQGEIVSFSDTKPGTYTVTLQSRLGGTSQLTETRSVKFRISD
jgi:Zn-dependent metalloprotease